MGLWFYLDFSRLWIARVLGPRRSRDGPALAASTKTVDSRSLHGKVKTDRKRQVRDWQESFAIFRFRSNVVTVQVLDSPHSVSNDRAL